VDTTQGGGHISGKMKSYNELKVNILEQTSDKSVVFTFGRFQPPTSGHQLLINKVIKEASKLRAEHRIYPSHSQDSKQNPLSHKDKVLYMRKMFPKADIVDDKKAKTPYHVLESLSKEGYKKVYFIVGGDRVSEFKNGMKKYVGKDGYDFDVFEVISAGKRDPDAEGVVGMSGSKMRKAAQDNDFEKFITGVPDKTPKRVAQGLFKAIRKGMGLKESYMSEDLIPPRRGGYANDGTGPWGLGKFDFNIPDPIQYLNPAYYLDPKNHTSYWVDYPVDKFEEDTNGGTWYRWARDGEGNIRGFTYTSQGDEDTPEKEITVPWPPPDWDMPGHLPAPKYRDIPGLYESSLARKLKMDKFSRSERKRKKKIRKINKRYNKNILGIESDNHDISHSDFLKEQPHLPGGSPTRKNKYGVEVTGYDNSGDSRNPHPYYRDDAFWKRFLKPYFDAGVPPYTPQGEQNMKDIPDIFHNPNIDTSKTSAFPLTLSQALDPDFQPLTIDDVETMEAIEAIMMKESYSVVIVDDPQERAKGLMFETSLDDGKGMLFVFDEENYHGIWMKNTLIPLDVVWINENMEIVDIQTLQPHDLKGHSPVKPARYVLEVNANTFDGQVGDILDIEELNTIQSLDESFENYLTEISKEARRKMSRAARRTAKRRARVRARKSKKMKSSSDIMKAARRAAIGGFKKKLLKTRQWSSLSHTEKANLEQRLKKKYTPARIAKVAQKLLPGIRVKERERIAKLKGKNKKDDTNEQFDAFLKERNYKLEYANYQGKPEQIARRSSRNKARRIMSKLGKVKFGDGMDVDHKDRNPLNNDNGNLRVQRKQKNRSFSRTNEEVLEFGTLKARKKYTDITPGQHWWMQKKWTKENYD